MNPDHCFQVFGDLVEGGFDGLVKVEAILQMTMYIATLYCQCHGLVIVGYNKKHGKLSIFCHDIHGILVSDFCIKIAFLFAG